MWLWRIHGPNIAAISVLWRLIPYSTKQGIFTVEQGIVLADQGIRGNSQVQIPGWITTRITHDLLSNLGPDTCFTEILDFFLILVGRPPSGRFKSRARLQRELALIYSQI